MRISRVILIAFMAMLAASFTIELPFTQVNYIHLLVNKKTKGLTNALKDTQRLHKTYYEEPGNILLTAVVCILPPTIHYMHRSSIRDGGSILTSVTAHPNTLRGPPALS